MGQNKLHNVTNPENEMSKLNSDFLFSKITSTDYYIQKVVSESLERISRYETSNIAENKVFTDFERVICHCNDKVPKF